MSTFGKQMALKRSTFLYIFLPNQYTVVQEGDMTLKVMVMDLVQTLREAFQMANVTSYSNSFKIFTFLYSTELPKDRVIENGQN